MGLKTRITKKLSGSKMMQNVMKLSAGTMVGQIISILTNVLVFPALFDISVIGQWAIIYSTSMIISTFSDFGFTNAIMIEGDENRLQKMYTSITTMVFIVSIISSAVVGAFYLFFTDYSVSRSVLFIVLMAIEAIIIQQTQICYSWLNRRERYDVLMKNSVINYAAQLIVAVGAWGLGWILKSEFIMHYGLFFGMIAGGLITLIHMWSSLPKQIFNFNIADVKYLFKTYDEFFKFQMPTNILAQVKNNAPVYLITIFFGDKICGYYSISMKVLKIPITFLANAIGRVYYQTAAKLHREAKAIADFTYKNITKAMKIAIIPMVLIMALADVFSQLLINMHVWPAGYIMAGDIIRIVAFNTFCTFLMIATQGVNIIIHKQKYSLISAAFQLLGYGVGQFIGRYVFEDVLTGCFIMTMIFVVVQIFYFAFIFRGLDKMDYPDCRRGFARKYIFNVICTIVVIFIASIIIRIPLYFAGVVDNVMLKMTLVPKGGENVFSVLGSYLGNALDWVKGIF